MRLICTDKSLVDGPGQLADIGRYRIGRSSTCSFVVSDMSVSRFHAEVIVKQETVRVKDLGSRNGTYVDGVRIDEAEIQPGQSVRFGSAQFHLVDDALPDLPAHEISEVSTFFVNHKPSLQPSALKHLSEAQRRVLDFLLVGLQEKEVAAKLAISQHTVHNHVKGIYRKMGVSSRPELLALFVSDEKKPDRPGKQPGR